MKHIKESEKKWIEQEYENEQIQQKKINVRYKQRHRYGRYEVVDTKLDVVICYSGSSEYANEVVYAMNEENKKNNEV